MNQDYSLISPEGQDHNNSRIIFPSYQLLKKNYQDSLLNLIEDLYTSESRPEFFDQLLDETRKLGISNDYLFQTVVHAKLPYWTDYLADKVSSEVLKKNGRQVATLLCGSEFIDNLKKLINLTKNGLQLTELKELKNLFVNEETILEILEKNFPYELTNRQPRDKTDSPPSNSGD